MNIYEQLESRHNRRMNQESKFFDKLDAQMEDAESQIGELIRDGKKVFYVWPQGGRYREGTRLDLINFLIRNRYA